MLPVSACAATQEHLSSSFNSLSYRFRSLQDDCKILLFLRFIIRLTAPAFRQILHGYQIGIVWVILTDFGGNAARSVTKTPVEMCR